MKLPSTEEFTFKDVIVAGDECWLITPNHIGTKWFDDNARFRSCIVRKSDNFVVSQGFGKFTNFGERPEFQPWDNSWKIEARHKLDGSLLIVSKYKGELIIRTRGTADARQMTNGHEIDLLIQKYPQAFDNILYDADWSLLFEWTTPLNIIVLREHNEPTLTLIGAVKNKTCHYASQEYLDCISDIIGVARPEKYEYNSIEECILDVAAWRGKEGVVLYSPDGQTLKKIKGDEYCELHKLATGITGVKQILDVFMASPKFLEEKEFYNYIETTLDFEIAERCKDYIAQVTEAYSKFVHVVQDLNREIETHISHLDTRKDQAIAIQAKCRNGWMAPVAFQILDKKELDDKIIKRSMETILAS